MRKKKKNNKKIKRTEPEDRKDKDEILYSEIRKSLIRELKVLTDHRFPEPIHHNCWRWAVDTIHQIAPKDWREMLILLDQVRAQGAENDFVKAVVKLLDEVLQK